MVSRQNHAGGEILDSSNDWTSTWSSRYVSVTPEMRDVAEIIRRAQEKQAVHNDGTNTYYIVKFSGCAPLPMTEDEIQELVDRSDSQKPTVERHIVYALKRA